MNPTATEARENTNEDPAETVVDAMFDVGEAWAAYGLQVSRMALLTTARTLKHVARGLDVLSKSLEKKDRDAVDVQAEP